MKVLIIGLGNIGKSHLKSFFLSKNKYEIYLYDKNKINLKFLNLRKSNINIKILKEFPKSYNFDLVIISTNSLERFQIIKKIFNRNKVKFFIIEKFLFTKIYQYERCKKLLIHKRNNIFINVWGSYLSMLLNIKLNKSKFIFMNVKIKEGRLLTNFIHYLDMYCFLTQKKINLKFLLKKKIKSKRKNYSEAQGSFYGKNDFGEVSINSNKNVIYDYVKITDNKNKYKIIIAKKNSCFLYKNSKLIKSIQFPFAYNETFKIIERFMKTKKNSNIFSNFDFVSQLSRDSLEKILKASNTIKIT